jgi:hypothetical protein
MRSKTMRRALLKQAEADMARFEAKYHELRELAAVITAMRSVRGKPASSRRAASRRARPAWRSKAGMGQSKRRG